MQPTLAELARAIGESLALPDTSRGQAEALRLAFWFVEVYEKATPSERGRLVEARPGSVGDRRYDALLAALAEHLCAADDLAAPAWAEEPDRFLEQWWFVAGLRSLEADALVHSPISFSRRGVFITSGALTYA